MGGEDVAGLHQRGRRRAARQAASKLEVLEELVECLELEPAPEMVGEYGESMRALWRRYMDRVA